MNTPHPRPRLYLVTPPLGDAAPFAPVVGASLDAGDIAAVLLRLAPSDDRTLIDCIKTIAAVVQRHDVALVLDGRPELAARAGADGAHLDGIAALTAALSMLKPGGIAGAGGLRSRHDAMLAAEAGADYVMFGEPDSHGDRLSLAALQERLAWWAEMFEPPCVGYAASLEEVSPLAQVGADFVALGDWIWTHAQGPAAAITEASRCLGHVSSAPA